MAMCVKSLNTSYARFLYRCALTRWVLPVMASVWPSGADFAVKSQPIVPPAPGRFSTKNCRPSCSESRGASMRAGVSAKPPGESGTTMRTGREG